MISPDIAENAPSLGRLQALPLSTQSKHPFFTLNFLRLYLVDALFGILIQWFFNLAFSKKPLLLALSLYPIFSYHKLHVLKDCAVEQAKFIWK